MKSIFLISAALLLAASAFTQVPQGISYQAIAFNSSGAPVVNGTVGVKISVMDNSASGTVVYAETHTKTTNAQGLFNLNIGQGSPTSGTFSNINWGTNSKFLKVELDPNGGSNYTVTGTNQLMSVPFALVAGNVSGTQGNSLNVQIIQSKTSNMAFDDYSDNKVYVFNAYSNTWSSQTYNPNTSVTIREAMGSFAFDDYTDSKVYACSGVLGSWSSQSYNASTSVTIRIDTILGNFTFDDYSANTVFAYTSKTGAWTSQIYNGSTSVTLKTSKGNIAFDDYSANKVFAYNAVTGQWSSQSYNANTSVTIKESYGNFFFDDYSDNKIYVYNGAAGTWLSQTYNPNTSATIKISTID